MNMDANAVETVWYLNTETGVTWEIVKGSPLEKRLRRELTDGDNPELRYEPVTAPAPPKLTRAQLNARAVELGVDAPEKLPNIPAVEAAIAEAEAKHQA